MEEIKAGDIMLNNWVEYYGKYYQISALSEEYPFLNTDAFGVGVVTFRNIKGIPLTEDILLKAGAKKVNHINGYSFWTFSDSKINKAHVDIYDGKTRYYGYSVNHCKHLHTLQNLFKSLTGNDLKIEV